MKIQSLSQNGNNKANNFQTMCLFNETDTMYASDAFSEKYQLQVLKLYYVCSSLNFIISQLLYNLLFIVSFIKQWYFLLFFY